ncbi:hypothetical protein KFE25_009601 [Diacronema lutheri]|uniref:JmjC domain-containing protein n=2 Tax=Diacronema lutheri TaxID=2081491 RepID=A0A8J5Y022_DIALT|nr:hypothetical protein KFE25_009601 [Diacronema lutheri]
MRAGPLLLTHALADGSALETWADRLVEHAAAARVEVQVRRGRSTELREVTLSGACELAYASHHSEWSLLFDERLVSARAPQLERELALRPGLFEPDWFEAHFPPELRPSRTCVIVGGEGARSTLHADPFEWVGTNVCLEGRKLWRFLPPEPELSAQLRGYRLPSIAWGSQGGALSAGWQSDFDLYATRRAGAPGARALRDSARADEQLRAMADVRTGLLRPDARLPADAARRLVGCVQRAGELLLIPPGWWHQSYYPEPSFCAAGQYLDSFCRASVFQHVLDWTRTGRRADEIDASLRPQEQVDALFALVRSSASARAADEADAPGAHGPIAGRAGRKS